VIKDREAFSTLMKKLNSTETWTEERKQRQRESMRKAVEKFPEAFNSGNRGRVKQMKVDGINVQGTWEFDFYCWCKEQNLLISRVVTPFAYEFNGRKNYFPDFYLSDFDLYVEIKGYRTEKDNAKWKQFPNELAVVQLKEINSIRKRTFSLEDLLGCKLCWRNC
jgi:hypothetical protein